jgi:hypothetical protein
VTCSFTAQADIAGGNLLSVGMVVKNYSAVDATLNCTGIAGTEDDVGGNQILVISRELRATGGRSMLSWRASDFEDNRFPLPFSISCNLPPGVGLLDSYMTITEDVGA